MLHLYSVQSDNVLVPDLLIDPNLRQDVPHQVMALLLQRELGRRREGGREGGREAHHYASV